MAVIVKQDAKKNIATVKNLTPNALLYVDVKNVKMKKCILTKNKYKVFINLTRGKNTNWLLTMKKIVHVKKIVLYSKHTKKNLSN